MWIQFLFFDANINIYCYHESNQIKGFGNIGNLILTDVPKPVLNDSEVLVLVKGISKTRLMRKPELAGLWQRKIFEVLYR